MVMGNLFLTDLPIHRKYDLKGSTQGRFTKAAKLETGTTLKDLDLEVTFKLEEAWHQKLHEQLTRDCQLLEAMNVMDYSLLLGVHYRKKGLEAIPELKPESDQGTMPLACRHTISNHVCICMCRGKTSSREMPCADPEFESGRSSFERTAETRELEVGIT